MTNNQRLTFFKPSAIAAVRSAEHVAKMQSITVATLQNNMQE